MHIDLLWLFIAGEAFLVLMLVMVGLLVSRMSQRRRDRMAAMHLVGVIKEGETKRHEQTRELLSQRFGLSGDTLDTSVHDLMRAEKLLYQRIINMYVKRDVVSLRELNIDVEAVTEPLHQLDASAAPAAPSADIGNTSAEGGGDADSLRAENAALKQELQITMETMSRMLGEYAAMFGGPGHVMGETPIMNQMLEETPADGDMAPSEADANDLSMEEELEGLEELQDFDESGEDIDAGREDFDAGGEDIDAGGEDIAAASGAVDIGATDVIAEDDDLDATVVATPQAGEIDLSDEDLDDIFAPAESDDDAAENQPMLDENGQPIEDELADMWSEAFNEQEGEKADDKT